MLLSHSEGLAHATIGFGIMDGEPIEATLRVISRLRNAGATFRLNGAGAVMLCHVASGLLDGYFEYGLKIWDAAAGTLVIEEAGGWVHAPFDLANPLVGALVVAGHPGLEGALTDAIE